MHSLNYETRKLENPSSNRPQEKRNVMFPFTALLTVGFVHAMVAIFAIVFAIGGSMFGVSLGVSLFGSPYLNRNHFTPIWALKGLVGMVCTLLMGVGGLCVFALLGLGVGYVLAYYGLAIVASVLIVVAARYAILRVLH